MKKKQPSSPTSKSQANTVTFGGVTLKKSFVVRIGVAAFVVFFLIVIPLSGSGRRRRYRHIPVAQVWEPWDKAYLGGSYPGSDEHIAEVCGSGWQSNYSSLHDSIRLSSKMRPRSGQRFVTFTCKEKQNRCGGLGDVLVGIVGAFIVGLMQDRALVIDWDWISYAFEPNQIDWTMSDDIPVQPSKRLNPWNLKTNPPIKKNSVVRFNMLNRPLPSNLAEVFDSVDHASNIKLFVNRGMLSKILSEDGPWKEKLESMGLTLPYAFGCILRYILRPKLEVEDLVNDYIEMLETPSKPTLCVHVRAADSYSWKKDDNFTEPAELQPRVLLKAASRAFSCATTLTDFWYPKPENVNWLIFSSSQVLKEAAKEKFGSKIVISHIRPLHNDLLGDDSKKVQAIQSTVAEWVLLSHCKLMVLYEAGLPKTAALYGMRPHSMYMLARKSDGWRDTEWVEKCDPEEATPISVLGDSVRWSGF
eukprot:TRINITY_DN6373_c0_g1_i1.p1 TRINITY_DN6373_c0_g1~~TRINITY_DN6373_c0_g1_i1.p1  ORF type:complete len:473 (+),score=85.77 TRINITY_DN6373_c0_g1_i1:175-1593(+)